MDLFKTLLVVEKCKILVLKKERASDYNYNRFELITDINLIYRVLI